MKAVEAPPSDNFKLENRKELRSLDQNAFKEDPILKSPADLSEFQFP